LPDHRAARFPNERAGVDIENGSEQAKAPRALAELEIHQPGRILFLLGKESSAKVESHGDNLWHPARFFNAQRKRTARCRTALPFSVRRRKTF